MSSIQKLILATVAYYDLFDFPLIAEEIKKYLVAPTYITTSQVINLEAVDTELYSLVNAGELVLYEHYYTFPKREHLVPVRLKKAEIAKRKLRIARRAARLMSMMPFVQAVFASGSLALANTDYDSDLDIFIVTRVGRIWSARFFINAVFDLLHWKRKPQDKTAPDKICSNQLITDHALTITNQNMFTARVYSHLVPLYARDLQILKYFKKDNEWIRDYVRHWDFSTEHLINNGGLGKMIKAIKEDVLDTRIGELIERFCRHYQIRRIERNPLTRKPHGRIKYNDQQLEFHPHSIESGVLVAYEHKLKHLLVD